MTVRGVMEDFCRRRPWLAERGRAWGQCGELGVELVRRLRRRGIPAVLVCLAPAGKQLEAGRRAWMAQWRVRRLDCRRVRGGYYGRQFGRVFRPKGRRAYMELAVHYVVRAGRDWCDPSVRQFGGRPAYVWREP